MKMPIRTNLGFQEKDCHGSVQSTIGKAWNIASIS